MAKTRIHANKRCLDERIAIKPKDDNLGMNVLSREEMGWGFEGLEEEREGVEIGLYTARAHFTENGDGGVGGLRLVWLGVSSEDGVPSEGFYGVVMKVKGWVG